MSNQKQEYDFFEEDIMKILDEIDNDFDVVIPEKMKAEGINMNDEFPNFDVLSEEIKRLNQSEELKDNKDLKILMNLTMKLPEIIENMKNLIQM